MACCWNSSKKISVMRWRRGKGRYGLPNHTYPFNSTREKKEGGVCTYLSSGVLQESAAAFRRALPVLNLLTKVPTQEAIQERGMFL